MLMPMMLRYHSAALDGVLYNVQQQWANKFSYNTVILPYSGKESETTFFETSPQHSNSTNRQNV